MRLAFANCVFDSARRELTRDGKPVDLTPKAFALLEALIAARPAAVDKDRLYETLWPKTFVEPGNLHNLIADVRAAIGDDGHKMIRTVHRVGYAFDADVRTLEQLPSFAVRIGDRSVILTARENVIGRDPACAIVLDTPDVSRHHARIVVADTVLLEDLGSKNGTFIGTRRIERAEPIADGADIVIGRTRITLQALPVPDPTITSA